MTKVAPSDGAVASNLKADEEPKEPRLNLRGVIDKLKHTLDIYGDTAAPTDKLKPVHPAMNPKNWVGAIFGTIFMSIYIALSIYYVVRFLDPNNEDPAVGEVVTWNPDCNPKTLQENLDGDTEKPYVDVPAAKITFDMQLWFYEEEAPSLQRIMVNDTTGYNNNFASEIPSDRIPKATAAASATSVPLNSWDDSMQNISSPNTGVNINLRDEVATAVGQAFTSETLKGMYMHPGVGILGDATSFFPHTAHLYIRFKREQLQNVKKCQIQPQFMNSGVKSLLKKAGVLNQRDYQTNETFPGLSIENFMWASSSFPELRTKEMKWRYGLSREECLAVGLQDENFDMLVVDTGLTQAEYDSITSSTSWGSSGVDTSAQIKGVPVASFTSWELSLSYVNNFVNTFTEHQCGKDGTPRFGFAFGDAPEGTDGTAVDLTFVDYPFPSENPSSSDTFDVMLSSLFGQEVVTVTKWSYGISSDGRRRRRQLAGAKKGANEAKKAKKAEKGRRLTDDYSYGAEDDSYSYGAEDDEPTAYAADDPADGAYDYGTDDGGDDWWNDDDTDDGSDDYWDNDDGSSYGAYYYGGWDDGDDGGFSEDFFEQFVGGNIPGSLKITRSDSPIDHSDTDGGAFSYYINMDSSGLPDGVPADWVCHGSDYWAYDGVCNCGCGAWDPDCGSAWEPYSELSGCAEGEFCSLLGSCMAVDPYELALQYNWDDVAPMKVSDSCDFIKKPGDIELVGYVGTGTDEDAVNPFESGQCGACPGDELYDYMPNKDPFGRYVCNLAAEGLVQSVNTETFDAIEFNSVDEITCRHSDTSNPCGTISMRVTLGDKSPFPTYGGNATQGYKVTLNAGDGNAETLQVTNVTESIAGVQYMTVSKVQGVPMDLLAPSSNHISFATLISTVTKATTSIWIDTDEDGVTVGVPFDEMGPYDVMIGDELMVVASAKTHPKLPNLQQLTLASVFANEEPVGTSAYLNAEAAIGSTTLKVNGYHQNAGYYGGFGYNNCGGDTECEKGDPEMYPLVNAIADKIKGDDIVKGMISFPGGGQSQYVEITKVAPNEWICPTWYWGDGWCDCGCGIYDPDCGTPTESGAKADAGKFYCADPYSDITFEGYCDYGTKGKHRVTQPAPTTAPTNSPGRRLIEAAEEVGSARGRSVTHQEKMRHAKKQLGFRPRSKQHRINARNRRRATKVDSRPPARKGGSLSEMAGLNMTKDEMIKEHMRKRANGEFVKLSPKERKVNREAIRNLSPEQREEKARRRGSASPTAAPTDGQFLEARRRLSGDDDYDDDWWNDDGSTTYAYFDDDEAANAPSGGGFCVAYESDLATSTKDVEPPTSATSDLFVDTITLSADTPLTLEYPAYSFLELAMWYDGAEVIEYPGVGAVFDVMMHRPDKTEYEPADRYKPNGREPTESPPSLDVDIGIYMVPTRPAFDESTLCPLEQPEADRNAKMFTENGWGDWEVVEEDDLMKVTCASENPVAFDSTNECVTAQQYLDNGWSGTYREQCLSDVMPPTHSFSYTVDKPINGIWSVAQGDTGLAYDYPALYFEMEHRFFFAHDRDDDSAEKKFAQSGRSGGDTTQDQQKLSYTGATNVRGKTASGSTADKNNVPANNPFLNATATLDFRDVAAEYIASCGGDFGPLHWEGTKGTDGKLDDKLIKKILKSWKPRKITWDTSTVGGSAGQLLLEPGFGYTLSATIGIYPKYRTLQWFGLTTILGLSPGSEGKPCFMSDEDDGRCGPSFGSFLSDVSIDVRPLDYVERQEAVVTFGITLQDDIAQMFIVHNSAFDLVTGQLGGAAAYITLGLVIYKLVYMLSNKKERKNAFAKIKEAAGDAQAIVGGEEVEEEEEEEE